MRQKRCLKKILRGGLMTQNSTEVPMTLQGKKLIEDELSYFIKVEREKTKIDLAEARAQGDLKENAEYSAAKEKQSITEGRILELQGKLARARVIDISKIKSNKIVFGASVTLIDLKNGEEISFQIVGSDEAYIDKTKISYDSPLGRSLIGKEEGDHVVVKAPKGDLEYEVVSFKFI